MKLSVIIGTILSIAALIKLLSVCGLIPAFGYPTQEWPYLAPIIVMIAGLALIYDGLKRK